MGGYPGFNPLAGNGLIATALWGAGMGEVLSFNPLAGNGLIATDVNLLSFKVV